MRRWVRMRRRVRMLERVRMRRRVGMLRRALQKKRRTTQATVPAATPVTRTEVQPMSRKNPLLLKITNPLLNPLLLMKHRIPITDAQQRRPRTSTRRLRQRSGQRRQAPLRRKLRPSPVNGR